MRSTRGKKVSAIEEDENENIESGDEGTQETTEFFSGEILPSEQDTYVIEKILGRKFMPRESDATQTEELFFIKWKRASYLHASWERQEDIERFDQQTKNKIKRFLQAPNPPAIIGEDVILADGICYKYDDDEIVEYYNPDFNDVHRIISCDSPQCARAFLQIIPRDDNSLDEVQFLVKWRGLPYNECTWEKWSDLKGFRAEVRRFWELQKPPLVNTLTYTHPTIQEYVKLSESPKFGSDSSADNLVLRDYQLEGVNWLLWNWWLKRPCILADEMGLGKTIQTVGFLHQLRAMDATKINGPFIIVSPLSLIDQWQSELATWSPQMNCVLYHGSTEARAIIQRHEFHYQEPFCSKATAQTMGRHNACKFTVLLTTYEIAIKDIRALSKINWEVLIVDEAHRLKNPASRLFEQLASLPHKHTVLLTGTPLQNKTEELWALVHFADKVRFANQTEFVQTFGDLKDASHVAQLHQLLKPYLLRRIKEDVEKSLPPKEETIVEVALTSIQKQFYRAIYERNTSFLFKGSKNRNQPSLMNVMMELRKCCNHPYLIRGAEERILEEGLVSEPSADAVTSMTTSSTSSSSSEVVLSAAALSSSTEGVAPGATVALVEASTPISLDPPSALPLVHPLTHYPAAYLHKKVVESSGKLLLLDKLLPKLYSQGRKVLIFSQMVRVLNILEDYLKYKGFTFERLDGSMRSSSRNEAVSRFCKTPSCFVMLLSTRAGGLGLNLTAADTVIIFDSDWNPHNDIQAQARAHRIGQTKAVMVYRLLTRKTYEMHMFHQASLKLGMDRAVLAHARHEEEAATGMDVGLAGSSSSRAILSAKEIDELLKRGAYDVFRDDDTEQTEFMEADIDAILTRRSHKVAYDSNGRISSALGNFSKASFVSADEKEEVDINDPDFWRKAVGLQDTAPEEEEEALKAASLPQQRKRKANTAYGDAETVNHSQLGKLLLSQQREWDRKERDKDRKEKDLERKNREAERKEQERMRKEHAMASAQAAREKKAAIALQAKMPVRLPPDLWGPHARDRVLRALNLYGFGRWEMIHLESGGGLRDIQSVEYFVRAYIMQCGVIISQQEMMKGDLDFVNDAVVASKVVETLNNAGIRKLSLPSSLSEEKFTGKLLTGGARKALNRLDLSAALNILVALTAEVLYAERGRVFEMANVDVDSLVHDLDSNPIVRPTAYVKGGGEENAHSGEILRDLGDRLPVGDIRPQWAIVAPWWDTVCDRHLLMGVFRHGWGRFDLIADDPDFIFHHRRAVLLGLPNHSVYSNQVPSQEFQASESRERGDESQDEDRGGESCEEDYVAAKKPKQDSHSFFLAHSANTGGENLSSLSVPGDSSSHIDFVGKLDTPVPTTPKTPKLTLRISMKGLQSSEAKPVAEPKPHSAKKFSTFIATPLPTTASRGAKAHKEGAEPQGPPLSALKPSPFAAQEEHCTIVRTVFRDGRDCQLLIPINRVSSYRGLYHQPGSCRWVVLHCDSAGVTLAAGCYDSEIDAAKAYDKEARRREGPDAICNFDAEGRRNIILKDAPFFMPQMPPHRTSKFRGVRASGSKWTCQISFEGGTHHLGTFAAEIEGAVAYDNSAKINHGPDAALNFPFGVEYELYKYLHEEGIFLTAYTAEGEVDRAWAGGAETFEQLTRDGMILPNVKGKAAKLLQIQLFGAAEAFDAIGAKRKRAKDAALAAASAAGGVIGGAFAIGASDVPFLATEVYNDGDSASKRGRRKKISQTETSPAPVGGPSSAFFDPYAANMISDSQNHSPRTMDEKRSQMETLEFKEPSAPPAVVMPVFVAPPTPVQAPQPIFHALVNPTPSSFVNHVPKLMISRDPAAFMPDARTLNRLLGWLLTADVPRLYQVERRTRHRLAKKKQEEKATEQISSMSMIHHGGMSIVSGGNMLTKYQLDEFVSSPIHWDDLAITASLNPVVNALNLCKNVLAQNQVNLARIDASNLALVSSNSAIPAQETGVLCAVFVLLGVGSLHLDVKNDVPASRLEFLGSKQRVAAATSNEWKNVKRDYTVVVLGGGGDGGMDMDFEQPEPALDAGSDSKAYQYTSFHSLTWDDIHARFCPTVSAHDIQRFYDSVWAPFCSAMTSPELNLPAEHNMRKLSTSDLSVLPNPLIPIPMHHVAARGLCFLALRRQRCRQICGYLLSHDFSRVWDYWNNSEGRFVEEMPIWWCSPVHDLALMLSCVKYGYVSQESIALIRTDPEFPFQEEDIERQLRYLFQLGSRSIISDVLEDLRTVEDVNTWVHGAVLLFPGEDVLQARLERMLEEFTAELPKNHLYRFERGVERFHQQPIKADVEDTARQILSGSQIVTSATVPISDGTVIAKTALQTLVSFWKEVSRSRRIAMHEFHLSGTTPAVAVAYQVKKKKRDSEIGAYNFGQAASFISGSGGGGGLEGSSSGDFQEHDLVLDDLHFQGQNRIKQQQGFNGDIHGNNNNNNNNNNNSGDKAAHASIAVADEHGVMRT